MDALKWILHNGFEKYGASLGVLGLEDGGEREGVEVRVYWKETDGDMLVVERGLRWIRWMLK